MTDDGYIAFRKQYEARHPASIPRRRRVLSDYPGWLRAATFVMFFCSALLSGVHTVPVVRAGIPASVPPQIADVVAATAFVSVEIAILLSSYAMLGGGGVFVAGVLGLATLTALTANVYSVVRAYQDSTGSDPGTLVVAVITGVVAPGIAFLSGKMYVQMGRADRQERERAEAEYRRACQDWDVRIEREWARYQRQGHVRNTVRSDSGRPIGVRDAVRSDGNLDTPRMTGQRAADIVREYLDAHPDAASLSVRDLAERLGVGKSTVAAVRAGLPGRVPAMPGSNGTHQDEQD